MPARTGSILGGLGRSNSSTSNGGAPDPALVNPPRPPQSPASSPRLRPQSSSSSSLSNQPSMEHIKRHSLSGLVKGHDRKDKKDKRASPALRPTIPRNEIQLSIESPPNVFYGNPERSQGALMSGILRVNVVDPDITLQTFTGELYCRITPKKPVAKDCKDCAYKDTILKSYTFLTEPKTLANGAHRFPFSHLFSGHLPATSYGRLAHIQYFLSARAKTSTGATLDLLTEIQTARSLAVPPEKTCTRVFPPTRLEVLLSMPPIIHPIGRWTAHFRLTRALNPPPDPSHKTELQTRWHIRRLLWHLEEKEQTLSPACSRHAAKVGGDGRGKHHEESRTLARDDIHSGFKADYTPSGPNAGEIELEFPIILTPQAGGAKRALCDVSTPTGLSVKHLLTLEIIIAEEWVDNIHNPRKTGATGQARILRAQFGVVITERAGLGISWEEEEPPVYEDVPSSAPPDYQREFGLPPLSEGARAELVRRAREAYARGGVLEGERREWEERAVRGSPPLYGVNSSMVEIEGVRLSGDSAGSGGSGGEGSSSSSNVNGNETDNANTNAQGRRPIEDDVRHLDLNNNNHHNENIDTASSAHLNLTAGENRLPTWREDADSSYGSESGGGFLHPVEQREREEERRRLEEERRGVRGVNGGGGGGGASGSRSEAAREAARTEEEIEGVGTVGTVEGM